MFAAAGGGVMLVGTACSKGEVQVCNTLQDIVIHYNTVCQVCQVCAASFEPVSNAITVIVTHAVAS